MKKQFLFLSFSFALLASCSPRENQPPEKKDSVVPKEEVRADGLRIFHTDSGRLEVDAQGRATLFDENEKVKARGEFFDNRVAGAWLHYDEHGNIISAKHISPEKEYELDKNDFNFREYENRELGAKFLVPYGWQELKSPNPALIVSFEKPLMDKSTGMRPNFNVARAELHLGDSLEGLAQLQMQMLHDNMDRVEIIDEALFSINGCKGFRRYGKYYMEGNNVGFLNAIIVCDGKAWFFSCEAQNKEQGEFLLYQGVFQRIVESFEQPK